MRRPAHRASAQPRWLGWLGVVVAAGAVVVGLAVVLGPGGHPTSGGGGRTASAPSPASDVGSAAALTDPTVECWNATSAARGECPPPTGRAGLASVFPGLSADCRSGERPRTGRAEVYVCSGDGYQVRYARWEAGFDRFAVFADSYGEDSARWTVRGRFAGRDWTSDQPDPASPDRGSFRWAATYRSVPYSVEVVADDAATRTAAVAAVRAVTPSHVGR